MLPFFSTAQTRCKQFGFSKTLKPHKNAPIFEGARKTLGMEVYFRDRSGRNWKQRIISRLISPSLADDHVGVEEDELSDLALVEATASVHQDRAGL